MKLVEERNVILNALLIQGLQYHVSGSVGGVTCPPDGRLAEVPGVSSETALVDFSLWCPAERQAAIFEVVNSLYRVVRQDGRRLLIDQIIAALDSVERVPLRLVLFDVTECGTYTALCGAGVTSYRKQL